LKSGIYLFYGAGEGFYLITYLLKLGTKAEFGLKGFDFYISIGF